MNSPSFATQFRNFDDAIRADPADGKGFKSFHSGTPERWERYKAWVRSEAIRLLEADRWKQKDVGSGTILQRVISAIEIKKDSLYRNNLVRWEGRYGPESRTHRALLAALEDGVARNAVEQTLYDLFRRDGTEGQVFEALRSQIGNRYDVIAYLFFLKDWERFMPVSPEAFSAAFRLLGLEDKPARKCTWESYCEYNSSLRVVRDMLRDYEEGARLIDAHSFCYMLVKLPAGAVSVPPKITLREVTSLASLGERGRREGPRQPVIIAPETFERWDASKRRLGLRAQEVAMQAEKDRLTQLGHKAPSAAVVDVSDDVSRGYDFLSTDMDDPVRRIEVKAVRRSANGLEFKLSPSEWEMCQTVPNYYFYFVINVDTTSPEVIIAKGVLLTQDCLKPDSFVARISI